MEPGDTESQLLRSMAELTEKVDDMKSDLAKFQTSMKRRLTKLKNRIETVELLDFQNQITALDKREKENIQNLVATERSVAAIYVTVLSSHFLEFLRRHRTGNATKPEWITPAREYVLRVSAAARERISVSLAPIDEATQIQKALRAYCEEHTIKFFVEPLNL